MAEIPLGWCITGSHDSKDPDGPRGQCPITVGSVGPCPCLCHQGETEPRGFLVFDSEDETLDADVTDENLDDDVVFVKK